MECFTRILARRPSEGWEPCLFSRAQSYVDKAMDPSLRWGDGE